MTAGRSGTGDTGPRAPARPSVAVRLSDGLAGLVAAGMLVAGVVLLLAAIIGPGVLDAAGLGPALGPGRAAVVAHLLVGIAGELAIRLRGRWSPAVRVVVNCVIIVAAVTVLARTWWW